MNSPQRICFLHGPGQSAPSLQFLMLLADALKPNGPLWISEPIASRYLLGHYGEHWRCLDEPRHFMAASCRKSLYLLRVAMSLSTLHLVAIRALRLKPKTTGWP